VHEADFGRNCVECHRQIRWTGLPEEVGRSAHARTAFPLRGEHVEVACSACHRESLPRDQRYRALTFDRCGACHEDRHSGAFADRNGGECGPCHDERGFAPSLFAVELHNTTSFQLVGRHVAVPCSACHTGSRPRLDFHVANSACADCHENPHGEQFATEMARNGCASCHTPSGWDQPNIDHSTWPLTGAHGQTSCNACHSPSEEDRRSGRGASYRGVPRECEGCHEDVHAGQFRTSDPQKACTECHDTTTFTIRRFDHEAKTGYELEGKHAEVECAGCHRSVRLRNGTETVRYRLGYRACSDCHANPHSEGSR
jgi:hypothetical protein